MHQTAKMVVDGKSTPASSALDGVNSLVFHHEASLSPCLPLVCPFLPTSPGHSSHICPHERSSCLPATACCCDVIQRTYIRPPVHMLECFLTHSACVEIPGDNLLLHPTTSYSSAVGDEYTYLYF